MYSCKLLLCGYLIESIILKHERAFFSRKYWIHPDLASICASQVISAHTLVRSSMRTILTSDKRLKLAESRNEWTICKLHFHEKKFVSPRICLVLGIKCSSHLVGWWLKAKCRFMCLLSGQAVLSSFQIETSTKLPRY